MEPLQKGGEPEAWKSGASWLLFLLGGEVGKERFGFQGSQAWITERVAGACSIWDLGHFRVTELALWGL